MKTSAHVLFAVSVSLLLSATTEARQCRQPRRLVTINPPTLFDPLPFGISHIAVDTRNNVAHIGGQVAFDINATVVGTTLAEQLIQAERSLVLSLKAIDAGVEDILRLNVYVVDFDPSTDGAVYLPSGLRLGTPPSTLISVPSLSVEGLLVELDATVAVCERFIRKLSCKRKYWK